jgi:hypothetical protein
MDNPDYIALRRVKLAKIYKFFDKYPIKSGGLKKYNSTMFADDLFYDIHYAAALKAEREKIRLYNLIRDQQVGLELA